MSMGMAVVMMLVTAMVVMVMVVTMIMMMVAVIVTMIMAMGMIVAGVRVRLMRMAMHGAGIGAAFGIERRLDLDDARAETPDHRLDHVIAPDAQALGHDLGRQMAIAEMPGDADQMLRIVAADFQ